MVGVGVFACPTWSPWVRERVGVVLFATWVSVFVVVGFSSYPFRIVPLGWMKLYLSAVLWGNFIENVMYSELNASSGRVQRFVPLFLLVDSFSYG
jgi:hypothetical protein